MKNSCKKDISCFAQNNLSHDKWLRSIGVRYAKFLSIQYFIDINILQNSLGDINIDISQNSLCEIDILQNFLSGIDINIDIFQNFLSEIDISQIPLAISILIFSKISLAEKNMVFVRSVWP